VSSISLIESNGLRFEPVAESSASILARVDDEPAVLLLEHGRKGGQVLALADLGILASGWSGPENLRFWQNLARFASK
jgi:hypothetical protein